MGNSIIKSFVFVPPNPPHYNQNKPYPVTMLTTKSGKKIPAYFMENETTKTTIVYSHGNAADIGAMYPFLQLLKANLPVNILHYEYIGYGLTREEFQPSEQNTYESVEAAFSFLNSKDINDENIIVFGTSVGSGPSTHICSVRKVKGLILECPFASICRIVTQTVLARPFDMFDNISKISKVKCPVLIIHGKEDEVVPFEHGKDLYEKVHEDYKYEFRPVKGANHHTIIEKMQVYNYVKLIYDFIKDTETWDEKIKSKKKEDPKGKITISETD